MRVDSIRFGLSGVAIPSDGVNKYAVSGWTVLDGVTGAEEIDREFRPIVSINLSDSKCTMTPEQKDDGTIKYILNFS